MPLETLDRTPPPFFKQGPSALSKLAVFSTLAVFLMVADVRFQITQPLRAALAATLYPTQWLAMRPVVWGRDIGEFFQSASDARATEAAAQRRLAQQAVRSGQVEELAQENRRLRELLGLRDRLATQGTAAEVLYDAADIYTRKVIIDRGQAHGLEESSPVIDESGVLGQVTRVHPLVSEVTLLTDREHAIPVLNTRTGARSVAYGDPAPHGGSLELRFMAANADVQQGDLLTTSGVDGIYPAGLPVATVEKVERRADTAFARITLKPRARVEGARHVMVLKPLLHQLPARPAPDDGTPATARKDKGARR